MRRTVFSRRRRHTAIAHQAGRRVERSCCIPTRPLADMPNEPSKLSFVYAALSFRVYDWNCPRLDTEWLLSTLFDASLLSTFKAAGLRRLFFCLHFRLNFRQ